MSLTELIRKNLSFVILLPFILAGAILMISLFQQPLYKSSVSLLVVQKQSQDIDARAAVKSAEQMADILSRIIYSENFRSAVLATGDVQLRLSAEPWKQKREWEEMVKTKNITDTGILVVEVYQPTSNRATNLATAIEKVLNQNADDYLGVTTESVFLRQLNPAAPTSRRPVSPNLFLNAIAAAVFGLMAALILLILFPNTRWSNYVTFRFPFRIPKLPQRLPAAARVYREQTAEGGLMYSERLRQAVLNTSTGLSAPPGPPGFALTSESMPNEN